MRPWALVSGASRGIGRAVALELADRGWNLGVGYLHNTAAAEETARAIEKRGASFLLLPFNLARPADRTTLMERVVSDCVPLKGLVHAAGLGVLAPVLEARPNRWDLPWETHFRAFVDLVRGAKPAFVDGASVVALTSLGVHRVTPGYGPLAAAKGALETVVRYLAVELSNAGVRVNAVCGGPVDTDSLRSFAWCDDVAAVSARRACRRLGRPEDIAPVVAWLMGPDAQWVRGQIIVADGGFSLE
jgi:enoyl-[acyl-carrier protein] reductase III